MNISRLYTSFTLAFVVALLAAYPATAQNITVTSDTTSASMLAGATSIFHIEVTNNSFDDLTLRVVRTDNTLPDESWGSAICMEDFCYSPQVSEPNPVTIPLGSVYHVSLYIYSSDTSTGSSAVQLQFKGGTSGQPITQDFSAQIVTSSVGNSEQIKSVALVYPNPASQLISISVGDALLGTTSNVQVFNTSGNQVLGVSAATVSASGSIDLNVSGLEPGAYFFRAAEANKVASGSFVIIR